MNKRLNNYLDRIGAKELDREILENYDKVMKETIPIIEKQIKADQARAAERLFRPFNRQKLREKAPRE